MFKTLRSPVRQNQGRGTSVNTFKETDLNGERCSDVVLPLSLITFFQPTSPNCMIFQFPQKQQARVDVHAGSQCVGVSCVIRLHQHFASCTNFRHFKLMCRVRLTESCWLYVCRLVVLYNKMSRLLKIGYGDRAFLSDIARRRHCLQRKHLNYTYFYYLRLIIPCSHFLTAAYRHNLPNCATNTHRKIYPCDEMLYDLVLVVQRLRFVKVATRVVWHWQRAATKFFGTDRWTKTCSEMQFSTLSLCERCLGP